MDHSSNTEKDIGDKDCEEKDEGVDEMNSVDLSADLDLPVEQLISNDLDSNQGDTDNPLPLPLMDCPTDFLGKQNIMHDCYLIEFLLLPYTKDQKL